MSTVDFQNIAGSPANGKAEKLFRATISAFCSLTRPSRREIAQLEELTLSLYDRVSSETLRFVAAALSECPFAPAGLVLRLCDETVEISAPLLVRSGALKSVDLIALIGRHGGGHAQAIAQRPDLDPTVARLVMLTAAADEEARQPMKSASAAAPSPPRDLSSGEIVPQRENELGAQHSSAEEVREHLRAMMRRNEPGLFEDRRGIVFDENAGPRHFEKLRGTALTGTRALFQTALADALNVEFAKARSLTETDSYFYLMVALRALNLDESEAFLLTAAIFPNHFSHPETIRLFLERYNALHRQAAIEKMGYWKIDAISRRRPAEAGRWAASAAQIPGGKLKAS